jgi:phospholipid/cholesterol/gamma-HCH transport system substrate-binding protein
MESDVRYAWVGAALMALLLLLAASIYWLTGAASQPLAKRYTVLFHSQSLDGVQTGSEVRMRGVKIGRVVDYGIPSDNTSRVRVIIEVDRRVPVLEGALAVVNRSLLTGLAQIGLANSVAEGPLLEKIPPGEKYPLIAEGTPDLDRYAGLVEDLGASGRETLQRVNRLLSEPNQRAISQTLKNTQDLTGQLAAAMPDLRATLADTRQAAQRLDQVGRAAESTLAHADRQIDSLARQGSATLEQARTTLVSAQNQIDTLGPRLKLSADLADQEIHATARALREAARDVQAPARALADPQRLLFGPDQTALGPGEK